MPLVRELTDSEWERRYRKTVPFVLIVCLIAAAFSSIGTILMVRSGEADREARIEAQSNLLACFNTFASDLSSDLPAVRAALVKRDAALEEALRATERLLNQTVAEGPTEQDYARASVLFRLYRDASDEVERVREENPYPTAPDEYCPEGAKLD